MKLALLAASLHAYWRLVGCLAGCWMAVRWSWLTCWWFQMHHAILVDAFSNKPPSSSKPSSSLLPPLQPHRTMCRTLKLAKNIRNLFKQQVFGSIGIPFKIFWNLTWALWDICDNYLLGIYIKVGSPDKSWVKWWSEAMDFLQPLLQELIWPIKNICLWKKFEGNP